MARRKHDRLLAKELREVVLDAEARGCRLENGSSHIKLKAPSGRIYPLPGKRGGFNRTTSNTVSGVKRFLEQEGI